MKEKNNEDENEKILKLIKTAIKNNKNFLINGGAGSGKTRMLIDTINLISEEYTNEKIICITFTNNAVNEINNRIKNKNLHVSTIHSFL